MSNQDLKMIEARHAQAAIQLLDERVSGLHGKEVPAFVNVRNWLQSKVDAAQVPQQPVPGPEEKSEEPET